MARKIVKACGFHCIKIKNLGVSFGEQVVLSDINMHVHCGTITAIIGRNGAGKSTLVRAILGEVPHTGDIEFRDTENGRMQHMNIGYVPQSVNIDKSTPMDVYDLICAYHYKNPVFFKSKKRYAEIKEALKEFKADQLIDKSVGNLSGGELQRVLLSSAVMDEPNLLLLDEPVSGIDKNGMDLFYDRMSYLRDNKDLAIVVISHDLDYVAKYADKVILIDQTVTAEGTPKEVFSTKAFHNVFGETDYRFPDEEGIHHEVRGSQNTSGHVRTKGFHPADFTVKPSSARQEPYDPSYKGGK